MEAARKARVAVIGAGPAGLVVAHELIKEGHDVTVFEASSAIGGAWCFDNSTDSDLLGRDCDRHKVHSSMYNGLRANLPRHLMTYLDFPFLPVAMGPKSHDSRIYPLHTEVLAYLKAFADRFDLHQYVQLSTEVVKIDPIPMPAAFQAERNDKSQSSLTPGMAQAIGWRVATRKVDHETKDKRQRQQQHTDQQQQHQQQQHHTEPQQQQTDVHQVQEWTFDAVANCVGTFSEPNLPQVAGMSDWPGLQVHSHNYRDPKVFTGMNVLVVGASFSGEEIARHIAREAKHVYHSARTFTGAGTAREPAQAAQAPLGSAPQQEAVRLDSYEVVAANCLQAKANPNGLSQPGKIPQQVCRSQTCVDQQTRQQELQLEVPLAQEPRSNITRVQILHQLLPDGSAVMQGGQILRGLDAVVYCTGYKHSYPWLEHLDIVQFDDMHVRPLWLHTFPPSHAPKLSFIGLPWRCAKMPQFQLQGQLLARLLSGRAKLPAQQDMEQAQQQLFAAMSATGIPRRYTHCLASFMPQDEWQYAQQLADLAANSTANGTLQSSQPCHHGDGCHCVSCNKSRQAGEITCSSTAQHSACNHHHAGAAQHPHHQQRAMVTDDSHVCKQSTVTKDVRSSSCKQRQSDAERQDSRDARLPQDRQLLAMPDHIRRLGMSVSATILERPDTFRDVFSPDALPLLHEAEQQMLLQLPEEDRYKTELLSEEPAGDASAQPADVQVP